LPGEVGEIVVAGPHVMPGYWRAPELSARTFRRDDRTGELHLHTGDFGSLDEDGYLYFEGRRDDMFKRKGIRMSTVEIEAAAMDIPGVLTAAVLPPTSDRDLAIFVVVSRRASEHRSRPWGAGERSEAGGELLDVACDLVVGPDHLVVGPDHLAPHAVLRELAARLEPAKVPSICRIVPDLPLTQHGKNARQALAAMLDGAA
jgi:acyl-CoA synthetase (AMP-forming)/AMP-acid ligase II